MKQQDYDPPGQPLVAQNPFRGQGGKPQAAPSWSESRDRLPEPVLPEQPHWVEMYWRAWEIAWSNLRRPRDGSQLPAYYLNPDANLHLSLWETAFTTQFTLYGRRAFPFITTLDNFYARQLDDGFIAGWLNTETGQSLLPPFDPNAAAPQVMAWVEWRYFRISGDDGRLAQIFWPLLAYHRWQQANRSWPDGFYWATGFSSGHFDAARIPEGAYHHHHWHWLDATAQATVTCLLLSQMALQLGQTELAESLALERARLQELINGRLWNKELNYYQDLDRDGRFSPVKALAAYWLLLDKELVDDRLADFLRPLRDETAFRRFHPLPSLSADSPDYNPDQSGVWSPLNYLVMKGLRGVGHFTLAHSLAVHHLEQVSEVYQHTDTFWDSYAVERAEPGLDAQPDYIGWTGLTPIAMLLEDVIGLYVDWPLRRVTWDRRLATTAPYGVRRFPLGPEGTLDLLGDDQQITVTTDVPFTLTVRDEELNLQTALPAGTTTLDLR